MPLGGFSTVEEGSLSLVNMCVFSSVGISNWALLGFCHARLGEGELSLNSFACPERKPPVVEI